MQASRPGRVRPGWARPTRARAGPGRRRPDQGVGQPVRLVRRRHLPCIGGARTRSQAAGPAVVTHIPVCRVLLAGPARHPGDRECSGARAVPSDMALAAKLAQLRWGDDLGGGEAGQRRVAAGAGWLAPRALVAAFFLLMLSVGFVVGLGGGSAAPLGHGRSAQHGQRAAVRHERQDRRAARPSGRQRATPCSSELGASGAAVLPGGHGCAGAGLGRRGRPTALSTPARTSPSRPTGRWPRRLPSSSPGCRPSPTSPSA